MELMKNLRWMCRVCTVNIRKRRSSSSAVPIFDTPGLLEKLQKHLLMDIEFNDKLPKSICSVCFRRIESISNFAGLAKKTENFLKDFINIAEKNVKTANINPLNARFQNEFASFALLSADKDIIICGEDNIEGDLTINLDLDAVEEKLRAFTAAEQQQKQQQQQQQQQPGSVQFIPIGGGSKTNIKNHKDVAGHQLREMQEQQHHTQQKTNLDQKRRNLKKILANNNSQSTSGTSVMGTLGTMGKGQGLVASLHQSPPQQPPPLITSPPLTTVNIKTERNSNNEPLMYDGLTLGCVIKDMDLLKLILKALKWPFTKDTLNAQIIRLKNTGFRDVMVDPNLLQDTDLMQILSSYLSPILLSSQQQQQNPAMFSTNPALSTNITGGNINAIPLNIHPNINNILPNLHTYKIPADTSVHLVSVPLEGSTTSLLPSPEKKPRIQSNAQQQQQQDEYHQYQQQQSQQPQNRRNKSRRSRKPYKSRPPAPPPLQSNLISPPSSVIIRNESPIEIRSDDDSRDIQMFEVNVDPSLYFPPDSENSQENSTESLVMSLVGSDNKRGRRGGRGRGSKSKSFSSLDNNHPLMKVRKKQRRKEAHIKLHTDRDAEQDFLIMNQSDHDILDICDLRRNSSGVSNRDGDNSKNGFVFDAETLKAQFPLVAIIDDNSNDDAIWAEFKVVESPTLDRSYNNILNQIHATDEDINCGTQVENQNESGKKGKKKGTKMEKVSNIIGNEEVKKEPIDLDTVEVIQDSPEKSEENTQTRIEKPSAEETASVTIKIEPELMNNKPLQMPEVGKISSTEEYEKINTSAENILKLDENKETTSMISEQNKEILVDKTPAIETQENDVVLDSTNIKDKKGNEIFNVQTEKLSKQSNMSEQQKAKTEKLEKQLKESKKYKESVLRTRTSARVQNLLLNGKGTQRSSRRFSHSPIKKKEPGKPGRPCKRMCKQCGFIFRKASDMGTHRKTHR